MNMDTNKLNYGKRDEIKKKLIENKYVNRKLKQGQGNSVPQVPVNSVR